MSSQPSHLEPSELGTKEYWNNLYTTELSNHAADPSDIGTCWFDDSDAESRTLQFLESLADDSPDDSPLAVIPSPLPRASTSFLDLGCGNGSLLFSLRDDGWEGRMLGVDYSPQSVALAKQISASRAEDKETEGGAEEDSADSSEVEFAEWDLISGPWSTPLNKAQSTGWDIVLDKGTFDAISLSSATDSQGRRLVESYRERMLQLIRPKGGLFLVTSCNWTEEELKGWFEGEDLRVVGKVEYPTFTFGGAKGQTISTLCFRKE